MVEEKKPLLKKWYFWSFVFVWFLLSISINREPMGLAGYLGTFLGSFVLMAIVFFIGAGIKSLFIKKGGK